jgi:hypothetical protein
MDKLKTYGYLILSLISVFILGTYVGDTLFETRVIEPYQWVLTPFFGLIFFSIFLKKYKKL